ncbi:MAG: right-handed parallel beta-helix repeat-containing protein [candidate division KSB1 bacterium]|nr:right-handed parallel beta-helix repeat-containing protein [candidate division KSB1 bacterium]
MKTFFAFLTLGLILTVSLPALGDFPIRQSSNKETEPVVVYNSTDNEYLLIWSEWIPAGNFYILGPVMGQRVSIHGSKLGAPFQIVGMAAKPSAAYNSKSDEYLVVFQGLGDILGQRINHDGKLIGGAVQLMTNAGYPRILYNELANEYFLAAYSFATIHHSINVRRIDPELQNLGSIKDLLVSNDSTYCLTYAPIAPKGRYLLSWWPEGHRLLDWEGNLIKSIKLDTGYPTGGYADGEGYIGYSADYVQSAFGYKDGNPVFLVVWDDTNNKWPRPEVPGVSATLGGVWGAFIDTVNPPAKVSNAYFPVTDIQLVRWHYGRWKPKVVYNKIAQKFMVAWNETPTNAATNDATVNHIRATTEFKNVMGFANVVLSRTNGNEDPDYPAIATSTASAAALVVWQDKRNVSSTDIDLYGNFFAATPVNNTNPGTNVQVNLGSGVTVTFDNVTGAGNTTLTTSNNGSPPPGGFTIVPLGSPTYYSITTTATHTGNIKICIQYNNAGMTPQQEAGLKLQVYESGQWKDVTTSLDVNANTICGTVGHLSDFAVMMPFATESITIISPNGNEDWTVGSEQRIKWTSANLNNPIRIEYSTNCGASYATIVISTANTGSYDWAIPNTPSTTCAVKILDAVDGIPWDISDAVFTISPVAPPSITVLQPNGGEKLPAGSECGIEWFCANFTDLVHIEYSTDGGMSFSTIIASTENDGAYVWKVPNTLSEHCRIKISDANDGNPANTSDADFAIVVAQTHSPILVTTTEESGPGSLREAILQANARAGIDTLFFQIPQGVAGYDADIGVWTIRPDSALPGISDEGLIIDGRSQSEFIGKDTNPRGPEIQLDGTEAGASASGLTATAPHVEIYSLIINHFKNAGIEMVGVGSGRISGCYVGTDFAGLSIAGNRLGIWLHGKTRHLHIAPVDTLPNVISANTEAGIFISDSSSHNVVLANFVGPYRPFDSAEGNGSQGILIQDKSDSNEVVDNRIFRNGYGVYIAGSSGNVVANNWIGTNPDWEPLGNKNDGVYISGEAQNNLVIENLIGHNGGHGVLVLGTAAIRNRTTRNAISQNAGSGIKNLYGGNTELAPPTIQSVTAAQITGSAGPGQTVEIYADENSQGHIYLGSTVADAVGNFVLALSGAAPLPFITATAIDTSGNTSEFSAPVATKVEANPQMQLPKEFALSPNYPNPFNPSTTIQYDLPLPAYITLKIFDLMGREIRTLVDTKKEAGCHHVVWDGKNGHENNMSSGVYFCQMNVRSEEQIIFRATGKLIFIK